MIGFDRNRIFHVRPKMNILHQNNIIFGRIAEYNRMFCNCIIFGILQNIMLFWYYML